MLKQIHPDFFHGSDPIIIKKNELFLGELRDFIDEKDGRLYGIRLKRLCSLTFYRKGKPLEECRVVMNSSTSPHDTGTFFQKLFAICELDMVHLKSSAENFRKTLIHKKSVLPRQCIRKFVFDKLVDTDPIDFKREKSTVITDWKRPEEENSTRRWLELFNEEVSHWILFPVSNPPSSRANISNKQLLLQLKPRINEGRIRMLEHLRTYKKEVLQWKLEHPTALWIFIEYYKWPFSTSESSHIERDTYYIRIEEDFSNIPIHSERRKLKFIA